MTMLNNPNQSLDISGFSPTLRNQIELYQSQGIRFAEEDHGDYYVIIAWNFQAVNGEAKRPRAICWKASINPQVGYTFCVEYLKDHRGEWDR